MKRSFVYIGNIGAILVGLLGLNTPYVTDAIIAMGLGGFMDPALLQPLFIGLVIVAIFGQYYKAKVQLAIMPLLLNVVFGIVSFVFIFPARVDIVGYLGLAGLVYIMISPYLTKILNKKNVVKIKA